ncbi:MAG: POTRA domain-containing protein [Kofleriaceae bacterium]|nr:POTRA domain-containing protein [Kofleriaceae bacterium]
MNRVLVLAVVCAVAGTTYAQPGTAKAAPAEAKCVRAPAPAPRPAPADGIAPPPVTWNGFELDGSFPENGEAATVRALLEPTMQRHRALTDAAREDIKNVTAAFGYHLERLTAKETSDGTKAVVRLAPMPMVRAIDVDAGGSFWSAPIDDDIRRRMRLRVGVYLAWDDNERACEIEDEVRRLEEFLADEGYFEADVTITPKRTGRAVVLRVKARLGPEYTSAAPVLDQPPPAEIRPAEIIKQFEHKAFCVATLCFGTNRFRQTQHQEDLQKVVAIFHSKGYPGVRVRSTYDRATSANRRTKQVEFKIIIDQRRLIEVVFEGQTPGSVSESDLRAQLTFNKTASADDVEAEASAKALARFLQGRGYFDARVMVRRERFDSFDKIIFRIEQGEIRRVRSVEFVGNHAMGFSVGDLEDMIATQTAGGFSSGLFGKRTAPTSADLAADVDRIVSAYRRAGYRDARVWVTVATQPVALDSAALAASLLLAERGTDLYVRFHIEEGQPTLLTQISVALSDQGDAITTPEQRALCDLAFAALTASLAPPNEPQLTRAATDNRCIATAPSLKFRDFDAATAADQLRDHMFSHGRPRAKVTYEAQMIGPRRVAATYKLTNVQVLRLGKIVIRGNFRTSANVIRGQLGLVEGQPLTKDSLAAGARNLRNTGLFDSVNIAMPDLDNVSEGSVNAVVEVTERYDYKMQVAVEGGFSQYNGTFGTFASLRPSLKNLGGQGISLDLEGTVGVKLGPLLEQQDLEFQQLSLSANLGIPAWLNPTPLGRTDVNAFRRIQDTARFGQLTTDGLTVSMSRTVSRQRTATKPARALTFSPHIDFRRRERPVDVLRPAGADDSDSQVPISTRTGSFGVNFEWEQRVDKSGALSPLAPEGGFRLEGQAMFATPYLGGQNTFLKLSGAGSKWWLLTDHLVLRADLRYDHGFPLGGAVLLPEVERFFGGGDTTVRGYEDDRLATEIIQVGVPPFNNVQQIRILPAGGNIRAMGSLDAQLRIWKVFATAAFVDAGVITNSWSTVTENDIRPSVGVALIRFATSFGTGALERAIPLRPQLGDDPRGRWHLWFAARAQF